VNEHVSIPLSYRAPWHARRLFDKYADTVDVALLDDLRILTSEIVLHSGRPDGDPIEIITVFTDDTVRVEVVDQGTGRDALQPRSQTPPSGLQYVQCSATAGGSSTSGTRSTCNPTP